MKAYHNSVVLRNDGEDPSTFKLDLNAGITEQVTVRINSTQALAVIFDVDDVGTANPLTTDNNGNYAFKAADNIYDIIVSEGTANEVKLEKVEISELLTTSGMNIEQFTLAEAVANTTAFDGQIVQITDRGDAQFQYLTGQTPNTFNIVAADKATLDLALRIIESQYSLESIGGGTADDTDYLNHVIAGATPVLSEKDYNFDGVLTLNRLICNNSTLKLIDSATVTGTIRDYLIRFTANATLTGKLIVDCNKASNAASPPTNGTIPGVGVHFEGGGHIVDTIRVINSYGNGFNHPLGASIGSLSGCNIDTLEVDNCSGGAYLNFQSGSGRIAKVLTTNFNSIYENGNPHAVDLFFGEGVDIGEILIDGVDGSAEAGGSAFFSGITRISWNNSTVHKTTIKNYNSTGLIPLAISTLTAYKSHMYNTNIDGWSQNRHIECIGMQDCSFVGGSITGAWKETHTGDSYVNTLGFIFTDSGVDNFNNGRDITTSNNNTVEDFFLENISQGVRDGGNNNRFINVRSYGGINGYQTTNVSTDGGVYFDADPLVNNGSFIIDMCDFSYMDNAGISANLPDLGAPLISDTRCNSNGIDTAAFINSRAGIRMDASDQRCVISNYDGRDLASENSGSLNISVPVITFAADEIFELIHIQGTQKLRAGMRLILADAMGPASDLEVRVEGGIKARDKFNVRAISPATGTTNPNVISLTGTWSGTAGMNTITGIGGAARSEITGKQFIKINTFTHIVAQVVDDNTILIEGTLPANFGGQVMQRYASSFSSTVTQNRAYHGTYASLDGVQYAGTIDIANTSSGFMMGNSETVKTTSITTSEVVNTNRSYDSSATRSIQVTGEGNAAAYATGGFASSTSVEIYNQTGVARSFTVTVSE